ncbi:MAG: Riboflavin biosynthesis protein RibF [Gemmatimonadaceae bacterium]|nr:Riboflavin biosynthesis protein RibF [Gemmatimonadaceae bacterium]
MAHGAHAWCSSVPDSPSGLPPDVARTAVTIGSFDGVHSGHQIVFARLVQRARSLGVPSLLVTFDPHPLEVVNPAAAPLLLTVGDEKLEVLAESGVDYVAIVPFTRALANLEAPEFVDQVLIGRFRMHDLLMGHDHGFGRNRGGNANTIRALGRVRGFGVDVVPPVTVAGGQPISSTAIRRAIAGGDLERARTALGRAYSVGGRVTHGSKRGRLLGFPTINIPLPPPRKLLPPQGVYAVRVQTPKGPFDGMLNLGSRPTFGETNVLMEVNLFGSPGDLYDARVRLDFVHRLRDTIRFAGPDELVRQLRKDATEAQIVLAANT